MRPNDPLAAQYRDLLADDPDVGADAGGLLPMIAALDALYAAPVPPAVQAGFAHATHDTADMVMMTLDDEQEAALSPAAMMPSPVPLRRAWYAPRHRSYRGRGFAALAAAVLVVALMAAVLHAMGPGGVGGIGGETPQQQFARLGGTRIVLTDAEWHLPDISVNTRAIFHAEEPLLSQRFASAMGVDDPIFSQPDKDHLVIELPGVGKQQWAEVRALLAPGQVDGYVSSVQIPVGARGKGTAPVVQAFTGEDVDPNTVAAQLDPQSGQPIVVLALKPAPRAAFAQLTARHIGDYLIVFLDSTVIESATIQSEIDGSFQIVDSPIIQDARNLAAFLKYGSTQPGGIESLTYIAPQR